MRTIHCTHGFAAASDDTIVHSVIFGAIMLQTKLSVVFDIYDKVYHKPIYQKKNLPKFCLKLSKQLSDIRRNCILNGFECNVFNSAKKRSGRKCSNYIAFFHFEFAAMKKRLLSRTSYICIL